MVMHNQDCPKCGSLRVQHQVVYFDSGHVDTAWFECDSCYYQWSDYQTSEKLLGLSVPINDCLDEAMELARRNEA